MTSEIRPIRILLVEDNPTDVLLIREALDEAKLIVDLDVVQDGVQALDHLNAARSGDGAVKPDIIFLDLNLPKKDGREVLAAIKRDPEIKEIPVVVLTVSKAEEDIAKAYANRANCYVTKPVNFDDFLGVFQAIEGFWLTVVTLPGRRPQ